MEKLTYKEKERVVTKLISLQALETMLYTIDYVNEVMTRQGRWIPGVSLGAHILDDCDKDTYGLEQAVDFIKGTVKMQNAPVVYQTITQMKGTNDGIWKNDKYLI